MNRLIQKLTSALITIYFALTAIFFGIRMAPGDPVEKLLGPEASSSDVINYRKQLGLDLPLLIQYKNYFSGLLTGNMGDSLFKKASVFDLIKGSFKPSLILALTSIFFAGLIGISGGVFSGNHHSGRADFLLRILSLLGLAFPVFSLAPLLVIIFSIKLNLFPVSEWGELKHLVLPTLTIVTPLSAIIMRVTRNRFLEEKSATWVLILRGKGMDERGIVLRVAKAILPTVLNVLALQLSVVLAGTMITETVFDIPGMGSLLFEGIQNRDYPLAQGVIVYITIIYLAVYFLVDYANEKIDPRIAG